MDRKIPARPVYEEDQIITVKDLTMLVDSYKQAEKIFTLNSFELQAAQCCIAHRLCTKMIAWVQAGKPKGVF